MNFMKTTSFQSCGFKKKTLITEPVSYQSDWSIMGNRSEKKVDKVEATSVVKLEKKYLHDPRTYFV